MRTHRGNEGLIPPQSQRGTRDKIVVGNAYGQDSKNLLTLKKRNSDQKPNFEGLVQRHDLALDSQPLSAGLPQNYDCLSD